MNGVCGQLDASLLVAAWANCIPELRWLAGFLPSGPKAGGKVLLLYWKSGRGRDQGHSAHIAYILSEKDFRYTIKTNSDEKDL